MKKPFISELPLRSSFSKYLTATFAFSLLMNATTFCYAKSLNAQAKEFFEETPTGSYVHAFKGHLKPSDAVKASINHAVTLHEKKIRTEFNDKGNIVFDYSNKKSEIDRVYKVIKPLLQKEIDYKDTHSFFYHGHSSAMSAYYDIVHEAVELAGIKSLGKSNPLHYKTPEVNQVKNMHDFFKDEKYLNAHLKNVKLLKKKAKEDPQNFGIYKNLVPFDYKKNLGVGKAPDSSEYSRDHTKCVNLSLFGNSENWAESSFLFFLTSGNIGKLDRFLTERLFKQTGLISKNATQQESDAKLDLYDNLFTAKMAEAGGGLMQIRMDKRIVDKEVFLSHAKGIPYYMTEKKKFAVREKNDNRAVPELRGGNRDLKRPSVLKALELYKKNPHRFDKKFSYSGKMNLKALDRAQARLFVNPVTFASNDLVQLKRISRNSIDSVAVKDYKTNLHQQIHADYVDAVANRHLTSDFYRNHHSFGKLVNFVFKDKPTDKTKRVSNIVDIAMHSSQKVFSEVTSIIKEAAEKCGNASATVAKKLSALEAVYSTKDALVQAGKFSVDFLKKKIAKLI